MVLPEPVGARMRVCSPRWIAGQPCACGGVGCPKVSSNQRGRGGGRRRVLFRQHVLTSWCSFKKTVFQRLKRSDENLGNNPAIADVKENRLKPAVSVHHDFSR